MTRLPTHGHEQSCPKELLDLCLLGVCDWLGIRVVQHVFVLVMACQLVANHGAAASSRLFRSAVEAGLEMHNSCYSLSGSDTEMEDQVKS